MYSPRQKISHYRALQSIQHADKDLELLSAKVKLSDSKLRVYKLSPARYAKEILYSLLDVATVEQIKEHRNPAPIAPAPENETPVLPDISDITHSLEELEEAAVKILPELEKLNQQIKDADNTDDVTRLVTDFNYCKEHQKLINSQIERLQAYNAFPKKEGTLKEAVDTVIDDLKGEVDELKEKNDELKEEVDELENQNIELEDENEELKEKVEELEQEKASEPEVKKQAPKKTTEKKSSKSTKSIPKSTGKISTTKTSK